MKTEREMFEAWAYSKKWNIAKARDMGLDHYVDDFVDGAWHGWQASAQREGYKLVPVEPTEAMLEALQVGFEPDYEGGSYDSHEGYKAMMGAVDE